MRRGTTVLLIFVLIAAGIVGASYLLQNQPPLNMTIAVDPLIEDWARQSVSAFNSTSPMIGAGRRVQISVSIIDDVRLWSGTGGWTSQAHPQGWLAASSASPAYARSYPFQPVQESVAITPLIIGGYMSRVAALTDTALNWDELANAAKTENWEALGGQSNWRFVKLAFSLPDQTVSGFPVLLSAAANFHDSVQLTNAQLTDSAFRDWFAPVIRSVPNFNSIGQDAAAFTARGTASVDFALAPESQWLHNLSGITRNESIRFSYPEYAFVYDFPFLRWDDATTTDDERSAMNRLGEWFLSAEQQALLPDYGLRPAAMMLSEADTRFIEAGVYGIELNPTFANVIEAPSINDVQLLLRWFQSIR
jgi:hypothetical protein